MANSKLAQEFVKEHYNLNNAGMQSIIMDVFDEAVNFGFLKGVQYATGHISLETSNDLQFVRVAVPKNKNIDELLEDIKIKKLEETQENS